MKDVGALQRRHDDAKERVYYRFEALRLRAPQVAKPYATPFIWSLSRHVRRANDDLDSAAALYEQGRQVLDVAFHAALDVGKSAQPQYHNAKGLLTGSGDAIELADCHTARQVEMVNIAEPTLVTFPVDEEPAPPQTVASVGRFGPYTDHAGRVSGT
jgi:hypothetical protein